MNALDSKVEAYLKSELEPLRKQELYELVEASKTSSKSRAELESAFEGPLHFGTAGLRAKVGPGPNRMNAQTVIKTTWAIAQEAGCGTQEGLHAVIAFDGRQDSRALACWSARTCISAGVHVSLFDEAVPTPIAAYAMKKLRASFGMIVTASHNPPADNGFKVYWDNAAQIIPPVDTQIAARILDAPCPKTLTPKNLFEAIESGLLHSLGREMIDAYFQEMLEVNTKLLSKVNDDAPAKKQVKTRPLRVVYTAMHGVGNPYTYKAIDSLNDVVCVSEPVQADRDPHFSSTDFPNPEEEGALTHALSCATSNNANLILANDPDADRLSIAIPPEGSAHFGPSQSKNAYVKLTGNQIGTLMLDYLLANAQDPQNAIVASTVVSTQLSRTICSAYGASFIETLTGFKWIANMAQRELMAHPKKFFLMGFEEAIGFSVGNLVRDKDGVHAARVAAQMGISFQARGWSWHDALHDLYTRFGTPRGQNGYVKLEGHDAGAKMVNSMAELRAEPFSTLCDEKIIHVEDYLESETMRSNILVYFGEHGTRLVIRPSGTEPKVKYYLENIAPADSNYKLDLEEAVKAIKARLV